MTVESTKRKQLVNGTGGLGPYPFTDIQLFNADQDMQVFVELSDGTLTPQFTIDVDYTLNYDGETISGDVTFISRNIQTDEKVLMLRVTPLTQGVKLAKTGTIDSTNYEDMVDKVTIQQGDQQDDLDRSIKIGVNQIGAVDANLPALTTSGSAIVINSTLDGFEYSTTNVNEIDTAVTEAAASATAAASSASSSASSASSASTSATNASNSADEAASSAASISPPTGASKYWKNNPTDTGIDGLTVAQVKTDLGVDTLETQVSNNTSAIAGKEDLFHAACSFIGNGSIQSSRDVTSVVRISGGLYEITMTNATPNTNYLVLIGGVQGAYSSVNDSVTLDSVFAKTTTKFRIRNQSAAGADNDVSGPVSVVVVTL